MKHPKSNLVYDLADRFYLLHCAYGKVGVNMSQIRISESCGTPMCHAGWYQSIVDTPVPFGTYGEGIDSINRDLGFNPFNCITEWANTCPGLWGNHNGLAMFSCKKAFGCTGKTISLKKIALHWYGVADRLAKLEGVK